MQVIGTSRHRRTERTGRQLPLYTVKKLQQRLVEQHYRLRVGKIDRLRAVAVRPHFGRQRRMRGGQGGKIIFALMAVASVE